MQRIQNALAIATLAVFGVLACRNAAAETHVSSDGRYSVQVEVDGASLPVYMHRGSAYILGQDYRSYSIRVFNHGPRRVEAVVTVDGRDVITGDRGDYRSQRGYIIAPHDSVLIEGFRRSWNDVAAFYFTDPGDAYATRRGDPVNLGVIGVAVFEERRPRKRRRIPQPIPRPIYPIYEERAPSRNDAAPSTRGQGTGYADRDAVESSTAPARRKRSAPGQLGTGYGQDTYSPAVETVFKRRNAKRPTAMLELYYDSYNGLHARGIRLDPYYRPLPAPTDPDPFPSGPRRRFAPTPRPR